MKQDDLQNLLDSLDEGPLGHKKEYQWEKSFRAILMSQDPEIVKKRSLANSIAKKGKKRSPRSKTFKEKMSKIAKNFSTEHLNKYNEAKKKPVSQFSKEGILINTYVSLTEAGKQTGIPSTQIKDNCQGRQKTCKGFIFKYLENGK